MRAYLLTLLAALVCLAPWRGAGAQTREGGAGTPPGVAPSAEMAQVWTTLEPGVGRELARWRAAHYSDVRYALGVELAPGAQTLKGTLEVRVRLDGAGLPVVLDWRAAPPKDGKQIARVWDIEANGRKATGEAEARFVNEHVVIPAGLLREGDNVLRMSFESPISATGAAAVTRYLDREDGYEYLYTLFVPSDASTAFPCFDQPDLKARFKLEVKAPHNWKVISNTPVEDDEIAPAGGVRPGQTPARGAAGGRLPRTHTNNVTRFAETQPISTYVFAFAAGPFAEFADAASTHKTKLYVRQSQAERARKELPEVFRVTREGLDFFARYFDRPFPFPKYDLVIVPEFPFRGMEHAGATFLREESVLFPTDPTAGDLWARADIMLHEAAHQWFGDLVTMRWFDDLWLKEGFATFMATKAVEKLLPQYDAWKVFYLRTKPLAYETDVTKGTTPIWQEIPNLSAAKSAYGNIVYRKAPSMLRQAEFYLGADKFQQAVRLFLKEHAFANAEWDDLVRAFERTSGQKLDAWAAAWVRRRGMADVRVEWGVGPGDRVTDFALRQRDVLGEGGAWPMRVKLLLAYEGDGAGATTTPETLTVTLDDAPLTRVREAVGRRRPAFVFANYEDYGYGRFLLDDASRAYVTSHFDAINDPFLRALLWGALWDSVREAELAPLDYIELAVRHLARERDEVTAQAVLARLDVAFNRYLSDAQRRKVAPRLEAMLFEQMQRAPTLGLRVTYFRAYRQAATTDEAFDKLTMMFGHRRGGRTPGRPLYVPEGMTLRSRDRFDIITAYVANYTGPNQSLISWAAGQDATDDGRRYAFAAGAAERSAEAKKKYFDDFVNNKELAESWIEAAAAPFNNPRQSELTLPYLEPALRALPVLKRTRKIFFVNNWLAAFIGGQCDERAARVVRDFLAREPSLDRDLRLKVLEAADGLERCVRIRARHATIP